MNKVDWIKVIGAALTATALASHFNMDGLHTFILMFGAICVSLRIKDE